MDIPMFPSHIEVGYHTTNAEGKPLKEPIHSKWVKDKRDSYCGSGYYFWENNIDQAKFWGEFKYSRKQIEYCIYETTMNFDGKTGKVLNLVGNRRHLEYIFKSFQEVSAFVEDGELANWSLGQSFEMLKRYFTEDELPFDAVRVVESKQNGLTKKMNFKANSDKSYVIFNPVIIVCYIKSKIKDLTLVDFKLVTDE